MRPRHSLHVVSLRGGACMQGASGSPATKSVRDLRAVWASPLGAVESAEHYRTDQAAGARSVRRRCATVAVQIQEAYIWLGEAYGCVRAVGSFDCRGSKAPLRSARPRADAQLGAGRAQAGVVALHPSPQPVTPPDADSEAYCMRPQDMAAKNAASGMLRLQARVVQRGAGISAGVVGRPGGRSCGRAGGRAGGSEHSGNAVPAALPCQGWGECKPMPVREGQIQSAEWRHLRPCDGGGQGFVWCTPKWQAQTIQLQGVSRRPARCRASLDASRAKPLAAVRSFLLRVGPAPPAAAERKWAERPRPRGAAARRRQMRGCPRRPAACTRWCCTLQTRRRRLPCTARAASRPAEPRS